MTHDAALPGADGIAADLLIRAANDSNVDAAWRVIGSATFKEAWLNAKGSNGETPLQGALRAGSGSIVGLILTHPGFDQEIVRRERDRRQLMKTAFEHAKASDEKDVIWAVAVMGGVAKGRKRYADLMADPRLSDQEGVWFLPKPGEWRRPATLAEMGVSTSLRPNFPGYKLDDFMASPVYTNIMRQASEQNAGIGVELNPEIAEQLWYLLVSRILTRSAAKKAELDGHVRSIGWDLYFAGSKINMAVHYSLFEVLPPKLEMEDLLTEDEVKGGAQTVLHHRQLAKLREMDKVLAKAWDKIGRWNFFS